MNIWTSIMLDPTVKLDRQTLRMVVQDQRRWSRRWLYPLARVVSRVAVWLIRIFKTLVPFQLHSTMDTLCVWFLHRFVSPTAGTLLVRHFQVETNLLNFLVCNTAAPIQKVTLRPVSLKELGNRAVIQHDLNVYDVLAAMSQVRRPLETLDFSMLKVDEIDAGRGVRRWMNLDIQTALCLMNIPFALCLTRAEYERAVHSLRLDESLLVLLADLTGDETFIRWRPGTNVIRVDSSLDVPKAVYEHALICEYAHAHLLEMSRGQARGTNRVKAGSAGKG